MSQEIIKTSNNHIFIRHLKNIVTFVGVLVVDIHLGGLLVNDRKALMFNSLLFFSRSVVQYRNQILNVDKANADSGLTDRLYFLLVFFFLFNCIICIQFN